MTDAHTKSFDSLLAVVSHLESAGYKISKSKIYVDRDRGAIRVNPDGTVPETEVRAYAATLKRINADIQDLNDIHAVKAQREVERLDEQIKKMKFEMEREKGKYVERTEVDLRMVGLLTVMDTNVRQLLDMLMADVCHMLGGDVRKLNQAKDFLEGKMDEMLNQMTRTDAFSVRVESGSAEDI